MRHFLTVIVGITVAVSAAVAAQEPPYKVVDGNKVDEKTLEGWRTWRSLDCARCHGPNQEGMVGPSLLESVRILTREEFDKAVLQGRIDKGMPNFDGSEQLVKNLDNLYAYLKGRSDGAIKPGRVQKIEE